MLGGVRVDNLTLPFVGGFELGWLAYPLTVLGIVAVVNVINFIDGVDGLAAGRLHDRRDRPGRDRALARAQRGRACSRR